MPGVITYMREGITTAAAVKVPCKAATTANITLSGTQPIDGVSCVVNDRVLVKNQTNPVENGIYIVTTGTWQRSPDFDGTLDIKQGTFLYVSQGSTNTGFWYVTTADPIIPGTTSITIERASTILATVSGFAQTLLDDVDAAAARLTLGLVIGTNVQAQDATLQSLSALGTAADKLPYTTAVDTWAETPLTAFMRTLLDDANAAAALTTLGVSTFIQTLLNDADAATARATLGLGALAIKNTVAEADVDAGIIGNDKLKTATAGEVVGGYSNLTLSTASTTYVKTIEFFILRSGTYRIAFDLAENPAVASNLAYARIYRNGVAVGTERTDDDVTPTSFTEDISGWTEGDLLQIYQQVDNAASASKVTNLKIKASFFVFVPLSTHFTPVT